VGDTLTQLNTGATLVVSSWDVAANLVWGQDGGTGVWDVVGANTVTGGTMVTVPAPAPPTVLDTVLNPDNTNPDNERIEFVMTSFEVMPNVGGTGS